MEHMHPLQIAGPEGAFSFLEDWKALHERIEIRLGYHLWDLTLEDTVDETRTVRNSHGLPSTLVFRSCHETQTFLQLGRSPTDLQWFCPTSMRLRSLTYTHRGEQGAQAELVIEHRLFNATTATSIPGVSGANIENLVLVLPLGIVEKRKHYTDLFDHLLKTQKSSGEAPGLEYSFISVAQFRRLDGEPAWLLPDVLASAGGDACAASLLVLFQEPLQTSWLPRSVLRRTPTEHTNTTFTKMVPATLREGHFQAPRFSAYSLSSRQHFYSLLIAVVVGLAIVLPGPVACLKRHIRGRRQSSRRPTAAASESSIETGNASQVTSWPSRGVMSIPVSLETTFTDTAEMESSSASESSEDTAEDAVDDGPARLKMLALAVHGITISVFCVMGLYPFQYGYWTNEDINCFNNFPWERHVCIVLLFATVRAIDMVMFVFLPRPPEGPRVRVRHSFWRHLITGGFAATANFANIWYDLVCTRVAYSCDFPYWVFMALTWCFFSIGWFFLIPVRCLLKQCSAKVIFHLASLDMSASCLEFHEISGRDVKWLKQAFMFRLFGLNASMMTWELIMAFTVKLDHLVVLTLFFSCLSLLFNSVSNAKTVQVMGTTAELEAYHKYRLREQLLNAMQEGDDLDEVKSLLSRANSLQLRDEVVLQAEKYLQQDVQAQKVSRHTLEERLEEHCEGKSRQLATTAATCLSVLAAGEGGAIMVIVDKGLARTMQTQPLDCGALRQVLEDAAPNICKRADIFQRILEIACAHTATDRWDNTQVARLEAFLRDEQLSVDGCEALYKQPMDGAMVLDYSGNILEAAVALKHVQQRYCLRKADGTSAGTRHAAAFSAAFWLSQQAKSGIVFVRSDCGGVHCFFGGDEDEPPQALYLAGG